MIPPRESHQVSRGILAGHSRETKCFVFFFSSLNPSPWTLWHWKVTLPILVHPAFLNYCSITFSQKTPLIILPKSMSGITISWSTLLTHKCTSSLLIPKINVSLYTLSVPSIHVLGLFWPSLASVVHVLLFAYNLKALGWVLNWLF